MLLLLLLAPCEGTNPPTVTTVKKEQMAAGAFDSLSHIMETYFSKPDEPNVSDEISEALMRNIIKNTRMALADPRDYTARSNLLWDSTLSENRLVKLGKQCDFTCHLMAHHIYENGLNKFSRFARNVWLISEEGRTDTQMAEAGLNALADFIREAKLPATLKELGVKDKHELKQIADSCRYSPGSYRRMMQEEILEIFTECF